MEDCAGRCYKVTGSDRTGRRCWYFVLLHPERVAEFLGRRHGDSFDLSHYGRVIISGYGETVPEETKQMLREKYEMTRF